jgi:hypothetical protein
MSDARFIKLNEAEFELIMQLLHEADHREDDSGQPAFELHDDLQEQWFRSNDEWGWPENNESASDTIPITEDAFIQAGIDAREELKRQRIQTAKSFGEFEVEISEVQRPFADSDIRTGSIAADRRTARLMRGTTTAFVSNDPIDW